MMTMFKSAPTANSLLKLLLNATNFANIADNTVTAPATSLYLSLHTADPGTGGAQTTSEIAYTSYARVAVARTTGGFTVTANVASLVAAAVFPAGTGGSGSALFWALGTAASGAGSVLYTGILGLNLGTFNGAVSGSVITIPGLGGVSVNDQLVFFATPGSVVPGGVTAGINYFVLSVAADAITVSATAGGASITISTSGHGYAFKVTPVVCGSGVTPQLNAGTLITEI